MSNVTHLLEASNLGDRQGAANLLPLVYDELRKLTGAERVEPPGHTLEPKALVREAYLRLVEQCWTFTRACFHGEINDEINPAS
jgi:hypothetical protein